MKAADLILQHPEYHALLEDPATAIEHEFSPESGQMNPFLHLSLHLTVAEQVSIDQPPGLRSAYQTLRSRVGDHEGAHALLECLDETIWRAERHGQAMGANADLECVRRAAASSAAPWQRTAAAARRGAAGQCRRIGRAVAAVIQGCLNSQHYSGKCRGVCPSCTTRRMVETAAHLADHVIARLPVRQWVLSVPTRLRDYLEHDPAVLNVALHIFLTAIERVLRPHSPGASAASRPGAVIFIHRFGALLNTHLHFHCIVVDGVFEGDAQDGAVLHPASGLDASAIGKAQAVVRRRLLRAALRRGLLSADDAQVMAEWGDGGGFSVDAQLRIEARERDGLERLLRYGSRPAFALERPREIDPDPLVHESVKRGPGGSVSLMLTPMQLLDRLAALIPPPSKHRHRYHGVLAPNLPLREAVTARAHPTERAVAPTRIESLRPHAAAAESLHRQADQRIAW